MKKKLIQFLPYPVKEILKKLIRYWKRKKFKQTNRIITISEIILDIKKSGIKEGDVLFVHSSLKSLGYIKNGASDIIEAFIQVLGSEGTLVLPTFSLNNSMLETLSNKSRIFDSTSTPSTVGFITNIFRQRKDVLRSTHPTHSVAAFGKYADYITKDHDLCETNFGVNTPLWKVMQLNGKIVGLGINFAPVTFYHVYEDLNLNLFSEVYLPNKIVALVKTNSIIKTISVLCHNPEFHKTRIEKNPEIEKYFSDYFKINNICISSKLGDGNIWWMNAKQLLDTLELLHKRGKTIYKII